MDTGGRFRPVHPMHLISVALLSAPYAVLTYSLPPWLPEVARQPGCRVLVPVGRSLRLGMVMGPGDPLPEGVELKEVLWPAEAEPLVDEGYLECVRELSRRQMVPMGRILGSVLPRGLKATTFRFRAEGEGRPRLYAPKALRRLGEADLRELAGLWSVGRVHVVRDTAAEAKVLVCALVKDPPWPVRPGAKKQLELLDFLYDSGPTLRTVLLRTFGAGIAPVLARLMDMGLVVERRRDADDEEETAPGGIGEAPEGDEEAMAGGNLFSLTDSQETCLAELTAALGTGGTRLLFGVTGSGKTAVYLELARRCLETGRSAVLLAPEVALAVNLRVAAEKFFPDRPVVLYHGYQSPGRRERTFRELAAGGGPRVVVGTRSALFLPLRDLGLVVLDEEHDTSFKQDERFLYQAKEVAYFRVLRSGGLLVLGSATPDVKTFYAAESGQVGQVSMPARVGGRGLPEVRLVNLLEEVKKDDPLAAETKQRLLEVIKAGDQAVIMINRRGYSPLMYCVSCGEVVRCPNCHVGLTYHKSRERLICHYCGLMRHFPLVCPKCGGAEYVPLGLGSEQLEERLQHFLPPGTGILRLDRDSARRQERLEEILRAFASGKAQVLVGTQMLSKGHHFPNVTLVVVADGDMGLGMPDYRAPERTFQLLVQVSGRAGRGEKTGEVLIQTRNPAHPFWGYVRAGDYRGFFEEELRKRKRFTYPPFCKLALIRLSWPVDWAGGERALAEATATMRRAAGDIRVLGPAPSPLSQLRGRKRFQFLLKGQDWLALRALYARLEESLPASKLHISLDLDPVDMM